MSGWANHDQCEHRWGETGRVGLQQCSKCLIFRSTVVGNLTRQLNSKKSGPRP